MPRARRRPGFDEAARLDRLAWRTTSHGTRSDDPSGFPDGRLDGRRADGFRPGRHPRGGPRRARQSQTDAANDAAQPKAAPAPAPADPAKMDRLLQLWEKQSSLLKTLDAKLFRTDYDVEWKDYEYFEGRAIFKDPNLAFIDFRKIKQDKDKKPVKDPKTGAWVSTAKERILCTGNEVWQYDSETKQIIIYPLEKDQAAKAIEEGPLPFLFNMKAEDAKKTLHHDADQPRTRRRTASASRRSSRSTRRASARRSSSSTATTCCRCGSSSNRPTRKSQKDFRALGHQAQRQDQCPILRGKDRRVVEGGPQPRRRGRPAAGAGRRPKAARERPPPPSATTPAPAAAAAYARRASASVRVSTAREVAARPSPRRAFSCAREPSLEGLPQSPGRLGRLTVIFGRHIIDAVGAWKALTAFSALVVDRSGRPSRPISTSSPSQRILDAIGRATNDAERRNGPAEGVRP